MLNKPCILVYIPLDQNVLFRLGGGGAKMAEE